MGYLAETIAAEPATSAEAILAEMLAGVMKVGQVAFDDHFFDDLGADSLVMAKFCARVRKRDGLPVMSMKDIYAHPTIRGLAQAFGIAEAAAEVNLDAIPTLIQPRDPILARMVTPAQASTRQYLTCGALQLLSFLVYTWAIALAGARAYEWISAAHGYQDIYLRSVVFGGAGFGILCAVPIAAKWVLIGRWEPQQIQIWSLGYFRFWIVKTLVKSNPLALVAVGSPLYTWYLRALGAKIGRGTVIFTRHVPVCTDLLTIGPDTVIRKDSFLSCYRAYAGWIQTGRVTLGRNVLVGEKTVLDINTSMGDVSQLGHASALHSGQRVRTGERWHGSPALRTDVNYLRVSSRPVSQWRRLRFSAVTLACVFFLYLPLVEGGTFALLTAVPKLGTVLDPSMDAITTLALYRDALVLSLVVFFGSVLLGLVVVGTVPRLLSVFIKPSAVYPLFGFRDRVHRAIARITGAKFFTRLFGDSSYITGYLRWLGYDLGRVVQTGSNFGTDVGQENPFMTIIGSGTMVADGLVIMNSDVSATSFRVSPVYIGADSFFGNNIYYPAGGRVGSNCLIATKAMIPLDGKVRHDTGLLGSPSFEIPRTVDRDQAVVLDEGEQRRQLRAKDRDNLRTIAIFLFARWLHVFLVTVFALAAFDSYGGFAQLEMGLLLAVSFLITPAYFVLTERLVLGFRRLQPQYCSIYDPYFWRHERLWKVPAELYVRMFDGTPFKNVVWRGLGATVGKRVFDDGCHFTERSLTVLGDDVTLNAGSEIQCHSQEDGAFKSDRTVIGSGVTIGVGAMVHYGVTMGERSVLAPDSFLMKGEEIPPRARWGGNPAREM
ncbi:MAG TPA: Pls/PosA family non-ribosomal peptide synthetase [Streptosporangiaceae bacterium]|jgi:non-ribosomal peptide synthetase-like protein